MKLGMRKEVLQDRLGAKFIVLKLNCKAVTNLFSSQNSTKLFAGLKIRYDSYFKLKAVFIGMIKSRIINLGPFFSKLKVVTPASIEEHLNVLILGSSCIVYCF